MALLFSNYSKADVVTVPIGNGLSVNVTTGASTPALQYLNNNASATQVNLGDDGTTTVPLQFQFSYFGKTFGTSWMHSNGVVSFQDPGTTGNFCCSGEVLNNNTSSRYNYAVMPLWTDLIGQTGRNTFYLSSADSITYGWYGTSQYGNGNNKSSFEVKLDSAGAVDMRWGASVISNATVTMGFTGDLSKGQFYQYYNGNNVAVGNLGVSFNGVKIADPIVPVVKAPAAAVVYTIASGTTIATVDSSSAPTTAVSVGGVQLSTTGEIAAPDNIPQALRDVVASVAASSTPTASVTATTTDPVKSESNKAGPSVTVMNAVKQIQAADKAVQTKAVQNANQQIAISSSKAQEQAMATVDTLNAMSASSVQTSGSANSQSSSQLGGLIAPQASSQQSKQLNSQSNTQQLSMFQSYQPVTQSLLQVYIPPVVQETQPVVNLGLPMILPKSPTLFNNNQSSSAQNEIPVVASASISTRGNVVNEVNEFKPTIESFQSEMKTDAVNKSVQQNDLAGGVSIAAMAVQPKGYELYSFVIKDAGFYAPKDIYSNQTTVDNARALRQLGSDRLHRAMVDQQFKIGE